MARYIFTRSESRLFDTAPASPTPVKRRFAETEETEPNKENTHNVTWKDSEDRTQTVVPKEVVTPLEVPNSSQDPSQPLTQLGQSSLFQRLTKRRKTVPLPSSEKPTLPSSSLPTSLSISPSSLTSSLSSTFNAVAQTNESKGKVIVGSVGTLERSQSLVLPSTSTPIISEVTSHSLDDSEFLEHTDLSDPFESASLPTFPVVAPFSGLCQQGQWQRSSRLSNFKQKLEEREARAQRGEEEPASEQVELLPEPSKLIRNFRVDSKGSAVLGTDLSKSFRGSRQNFRRHISGAKGKKHRTYGKSHKSKKVSESGEESNSPSRHFPLIPLEDISPLPRSHTPREEVTEERLAEVLRLTGKTEWRPGQKETVERIARGLSTLAILPTGGGKSLIYQTAALLAPPSSLVIVVSPLLALIADQLLYLPTALPGASLGSHVSPAATAQVFEDVKQGKLRILFVAPERFGSRHFLECLADCSLAFVCVDEVHCLSQWSHNFRPAYLTLRSILTSLGVTCILGLTATATRQTERSICEMLDIPPEGVIRCSPLRSNLHLSVSKDPEKLRALEKVLALPQFASSQSTIIYCFTKHSTEVVASHLREKGREVEYYHAGRTLQERKKIQEAFMNGSLHIVVATVAFGLGLNKRDVRAVLHYDAPRTLEAYVQEIGRAGRDGEAAFCHLFFDPLDLTRYRSFVFGDSADLITFKRLVERIFPKEEGYHGLIVDDLSRDLDVHPEVITTQLAILQVEGWISLGEILPAEFVVQFLSSSSSAPSLVKLLRKGKAKVDGKFISTLLGLSDTLGVPPNKVMEEIQILQGEWIQCSESGALQIFKIRRAPSDPSSLAKDLWDRQTRQEDHQLNQVAALEHVLKTAALPSVKDIPSVQTDHSLQEHITEYFEDRLEVPSTSAKEISPSNASLLRGDIATLRRSYPGTLTGRSIARILHGLASPSFPLHMWMRDPSWGRHSSIDFRQLCRFATEELIRLK